ncbi:putative MFS transporter [Cryomyces antarcticus]
MGANKLYEDCPLSSDDGVQIDTVDWDGPNDPENPFNWPKSKKWLLTLTAAFVTLIVCVNGTSITVAAEEINQQFGVSDEHFPHSYWVVTSWNLGAALVPLMGLPLMEDLGVRYGYLISYALFVTSIIPQAVARNYATLIVVRFFAGGCVGLLSNVIGGIISDVWEGEEGRSLPMSVYIWTYLVGTTIGPVIGAGILQHLNWRWIFYIQLIFYGALFPVFYLLIRETRGPIILKRRAQQIRRKLGSNVYAQSEINAPALLQVLKEAIARPTNMFFTEWVLFFFTLWSAFAFGTIFIFTQSIGQVFASLYNWPAYSTGYVQVAVVVGETLGCLASFYQDRLYLQSASRNTETPGLPIPEARLYLSVPGSFLGITAGLFVYAWTSHPSVPWIAPAIGLGMVGFGIMVVVTAVTTYITDAYSKYAASALAAIAFGENLFAAFLPLAAQSMYRKLGFGWASSLLGFLALALSFAPVVLLIWGGEARRRSPFMSQASYT